MTKYIDLFEDLRHRPGDEIGLTDWFVVDKAKNQMFSLLTQASGQSATRQSVESAESVGWADPLFLLALHAGKSKDVGIPVETTDEVTAFNYGYDSVEWNRPIRIGDRIRARVCAGAVDEPRAGQYRARLRVDYEVEGEQEPAVVAHTILYCLPPADVRSLTGG